MRIEDVRIDVSMWHGQEKYVMTHKPTGAAVVIVGNPHVTNERKQAALDTLKENVDKL